MDRGNRRRSFAVVFDRLSFESGVIFMTANGYLQIAFYLVVLLVSVKPLGHWMTLVYEGRVSRRAGVLGTVETVLYRLCGIDEQESMDWRHYALHCLAFNFVGIAFVYLLQRVQSLLPLNPQALGAVGSDLAFNTAISFGTNTNWQAYGGETTLSYLTQMLGLTAQNFVSAAVGMAVLVALIRGIRQKNSPHIGHFYVDLVRGTLYILLPLSLVGVMLLVSQGVIQTLQPYQTAQVLDRAATGAETQTLAMGPAASQIIIKQLGTNGGGYFNVNSTHPYENPTPLSNFIEMLAILLIPAALCYTFGEMVNDKRQGWAILAAMTVIFVGFLAVCVVSEQAGNPQLAPLGADMQIGGLHSGGNMEGKETRFGIVNSAIWATATTAASNGSVNSMHDSYTPLGGLVPMLLMMLGEVVYGGVGSGLYGMLALAIIAVFVAGLMVGRTPEYLGKKIEAYEMKMVSLAVLIPAAAVLIGTAIVVSLPSGLNSIWNPGGPHGLSEVLYATASASNNNGSAFAGFGANTILCNILLGICMLLGRYVPVICMLAVAGSLAEKKLIPAGLGTMPTHTPLFVCVLISVVLLVAGLTFFPALALGPIVEHLILNS